MLKRISAAWARVEMASAALLAFAVTLLILLNVVTRSLNSALFWVDEAAIYTMVWMTFLGASAAIHYRQQVAITIVTDPLPLVARRIAAKIVDALIFVFAAAMLYFCWRWYLPADIWNAGFDTVAFQGNTFNFIYAEPTSTIGIQKWIIWLVMPLFSLGVFLHALTHLLDFDPPEAHRQGVAT
ncbi:MAG: TRAP transporter small permease subunit [Roseicyclus sp.]|nr:TRAP transporter small permease subunit [Roseicyclus sp.]